MPDSLARPVASACVRRCLGRGNFGRDACGSVGRAVADRTDQCGVQLVQTDMLSLPPAVGGQRAAETVQHLGMQGKRVRGTARRHHRLMKIRLGRQKARRRS